MATKLPRLVDNMLEKVTNTDPRTHTILLLSIILLGFLLRLYSLYAGQGYREFAIGDELEAFQLALELLAGVDYAWYIGQPNFSGGHAPGPLWTLFWLLTYRLGGYSLDGAMFVMLLLNTCVIYLVYRLANIFLGRDYALLTALLYATGPWPVYYSTGVWNPVPMAFFGAILYLSLWDVTRRDNARSIFLVCLVAAATPQFHMISVFYWPAILLILYLAPVRLNRKWFMLGIIAGMALYLPYLIGEMNNDWENTQAIINESMPRSFGVAKIISTPIAMISNQIGRWTDYGFFGYWEYGDAYFGSYLVLLAINVFSLLISLIIFGSFIRILFGLRHGSWRSLETTYAENPAVMFFGILLIVPSLLFLLTAHNYGSRYAIAALPLLFILPAAYLRRLDTRKYLFFFRSAVALLVVINIYLVLSFNHHQGNLIENGDVFMPSFRKLETARQAIRAKTEPGMYIELDPTDYVNDQPEYMQLGGLLLSQYMSITESFISHSEPPPQTITYYIEPAPAPKRADQTIIYQTNGLAVIDRKHR